MPKYAMKKTKRAPTLDSPRSRLGPPTTPAETPRTEPLLPCPPWNRGREAARPFIHPYVRPSVRRSVRSFIRSFIWVVNQIIFHRRQRKRARRREKVCTEGGKRNTRQGQEEEGGAKKTTGGRCGGGGLRKGSHLPECGRRLAGYDACPICIFVSCVFFVETPAVSSACPLPHEQKLATFAVLSLTTAQSQFRVMPIMPLCSCLYLVR